MGVSDNYNIELDEGVAVEVWRRATDFSGAQSDALPFLKKFLHLAL